VLGPEGDPVGDPILTFSAYGLFGKNKGHLPRVLMSICSMHAGRRLRGRAYI